MPEINVQFTDSGEILGALNVSTAACTDCGGPARVPEYVVGVLERPGRNPLPLVICPDCTPGFLEEMRNWLEGGAS